MMAMTGSGQARRALGSRAVPVVLVALLLTLLVFGVVADRALVGQARAAREAVASRADETARVTALSVKAALAEIEQAVAAGRAPQAVVSDRLALPPSLALPVVPADSYASRSRADLSRLLSSSGTTPNGLPEAVVARLLLGEASPVSGTERPPDVADLLLSGQLPVRPADLPHLAQRLGAGRDPRVRTLQERLRRMPRTSEIPNLPVFRCRLADGDAVEGWSRRASTALRYQVAVATLLHEAEADSQAVLAASADRETFARGATPTTHGMTRLIQVPDVAGLVLAVTPEVPGALRLAALRIVLLLSIVAGVFGLAAARRAFARESRAVARERAFLTSVTHELRTPLTAIRLLGERLADGRGDPRDYGALVAQESHRLEDLVERVLTATRVEEAPRFAPVSPGGLARSAADLIALRAERRGVEIEQRVEDGLPEARWDADAVRSAVLNLLDNAVKHGKEGGHVVLRTWAIGEEVRLSVTDDGPGIGRADRDGLFRRFVRGASAAPGTGLGLHIVEQVARAHGGRVDLVTQEGHGTTFTLILPVIPPGAEVRA
jgi:signal transduction histidine kinase